MTKEEILESVSMRDVLEKYGVQVGKGGMCKCPIHGEEHPSMKVFPDGYKCFACNSSGDIFKFVQEMEKCDFKAAFKLLGGTYEHSKNPIPRATAKKRFEREKLRRAKAKADEKEFRRILDGTIDLCRSMIALSEPLSDDWCFAQNKLPWLWHVYETKYLEGEEVNENDVFRAYREIRQRYVTF